MEIGDVVGTGDRIASCVNVAADKSKMYATSRNSSTNNGHIHTSRISSSSGKGDDETAPVLKLSGICKSLGLVRI